VTAVSVTAITTLPDTDPAVTVTVMFRIDLSLPAKSLAVTAPDASDTADTTCRLPDVALKTTFAPGIIAFEAFLTKAVIVTSAPDDCNTLEDVKTSMVAAVLPTTVTGLSVTAITALPVTDPAVTVTVIFRTDLSLPAESFAVTAPESSETAETTCRVPDVVEKTTFLLGIVVFDAFFT